MHTSESGLPDMQKSFDSIVANFAFSQFDQIVEELKEVRNSGISEDAVIEFLAARAKGIDTHTREKLYLLSLNITPTDDFTINDVAALNRPNQRTLNIEFLLVPPTLRRGALVFFESKRWIVTFIDANHSRLKLF